MSTTYPVPVHGHYSVNLSVPVEGEGVEYLKWTGPLRLTAFGRDETGNPVSWPAQDVLPWYQQHPEAIIAQDWAFACPGVPCPEVLPRYPIQWDAGFVYSGGYGVLVRDASQPDALERALVHLLGHVIMAQANGQL